MGSPTSSNMRIPEVYRTQLSPARERAVNPVTVVTHTVATGDKIMVNGRLWTVMLKTSYGDIAMDADNKTKDLVQLLPQASEVRKMVIVDGKAHWTITTLRA